MPSRESSHRNTFIANSFPDICETGNCRNILAACPFKACCANRSGKPRPAEGTREKIPPAFSGLAYTAQRASPGNAARIPLEFSSFAIVCFFPPKPAAPNVPASPEPQKALGYESLLPSLILLTRRRGLLHEERPELSRYFNLAAACKNQNGASLYSCPAAAF